MRRSTALPVLAAILAVVAALAIGSVRLDSATADEPAHIVAGYLKLVHGRLDFFREQQPLMNTLSALPLVIAGHHTSPPPAQRVSDHWGVGRDYVYRSEGDPHRMLFLARLPTILLFLILCAVAYAFVAAETSSRAWGLAAATLVGFCPKVMAHGRLATVDLAATLFLFVSVALLIRLIRKPSWPIATALGAVAAAAVLSKTSCLILAPFALVIVAVAIARGRIAEPRRFAALLMLAMSVAAVAIESFLLLMARSTDLFLPIREIAANVEVIRVWYSGRQHFKLQYFMGEFSERGWRSYYLTALALKLTLPSIAIVLGALGAAAWKRRLPFGAAASFLFAAVFLGVAAAGELALGARYVMPVLPFLYAAACIVLHATLPAGRTALLIGVLLAWHVGANLSTYPSYISYFNPLIGSHRNADRFLIDSNLDWGQDLRRLDQWARRAGVPTIALDYFGGGDLDADLTVAYTSGWGPAGPPLPAGYFAVSRHYYRASFYPGRKNYADYLEASRARFVTSIGGSIDVYRVGDDGIRAERRIRLRRYDGY